MLVAAVYVAGGRFGLQLDAVSGFATLVWPPSGVALAALILFGPRVWPGVSIGAFVVNFWAGAPVPVALGIAVGNTLEAVFGAFILRLVTDFRPALGRVKDVNAFVFAAGSSTVAGATIGVSSLVLGRLVPASQFAITWGAWWLGDTIGDLIVGTLILTWAAGGVLRLRPARAAEATAALALLLGIALLIFGAPPPAQGPRFWQAYMVAPALVWIALRFEPRGISMAIALVAVIAIAHTARDTGPFAAGPLFERLFFLQTFMAVTDVTFLTLAAAMSETGRAQADRARLLEAERTARTNAENAEREARFANKAKSDFLAVMSHELRTPLTAIVGYTDLLQSGLSGPLADKQKEYLARIKATSDHLRELIDGILTFSRLEVGQEADLQMEKIDVANLVQEVAHIAEPLVKAKGLNFSLELASGMSPVVTDQRKLRQILLNLLSNAVKFTEKGEIKLTGRIEDNRMLLGVSDTGSGIAPEHLEKIFEPFWQVEQGLTRSAGGAGLGLNVSRRLARAMGGELAVQSVPGHGSAFTVELPVDSAA